MNTASKKFGFWSIVLLAINSIIGTGIFLSPAGVIKVAGTYTPLIYILAAVFAGILAVTFASAAKYTNKNGAAFAYAHVAFGRDVGFYVGITRFVAAAIAWGVLASAVVKTTYLILGIEATLAKVTLGFIVLMAILLIINLSGTYVTKIFSNLSTIGKVGALLVAIIAGFAIFALTGINHFSEVNSVVNPDTGAPYVQPMTVTVFVTAVLSAFYAFTGFESVASAASEMDQPEKNLPRALPIAIGLITLIYLGIVCGALLINPVDLMNSKNPVVLAAAYKNPIIQNIIVYGALLSMFGINIAASFHTPRVFEALATEGMVPTVLTKKNSRGVPIYAFLITAAVAIIVPMAFQYNVGGILVISSVSRFIQFLVVPFAVIAFYKKKTAFPILEAKRNLVTDVIIPILAFVLSVFLLVKFNWAGSFSLNGAPNYYAIAAMVIGYVILPLVLYVPMKKGLYRKQA